MAIDDALIRPVNHYLGGRVGVTMSCHEEISVKANLEDVRPDIEGARGAFMTDLTDMLSNPAKYVKINGYQLRPEDKDFLQSLMEKAEQADWLKPADVQELSDYIAAYCPASPIREGFLGSK